MKYTDFANLSDNELLAIIRTNSDDSDGALDCLIKRHKKLVLAQAHSLFLIGADREDLIQEGMIGLYKAIREYDSKKDTSFTSFAISLVRGQMINTITAYNRMKHKPLNDSLSLDTTYDTSHEGDENLSFIDIMEDPSLTSNPEDLIIDKEKVSMIQYELGKRLSPFEQAVYNMSIEGMDYKQIANALGKTPKAVDNARSRIKSKLAKLMDEMT